MGAMEDLEIKRALISLSDKEGIDDLANQIKSRGGSILASGGTASYLESLGLECEKVEDLTGYAAMLDGRVKTLHPKIFGGILADTGREKHKKELEELGIKKLDMVVVNLYPFEKVAADINDVGEEEKKTLIENIDIGGVALIRAAAKNCSSTAVLTCPEQYGPVLEEMKANDMSLSLRTRERLAVEAIRHTAWYDSIISTVLGAGMDSGREGMPNRMILALNRHAKVRYGENPEQKAAIFTPPMDIPVIARSFHDWERAMPGMIILQGKQMSFNNYMDTYSAWAMVNSWARPCCCFVKHTNPCGLAADEDAERAFKKAYDCDPMSAFGGIIALNRPFTGAMGETIKGKFFEVIIAPSYEKDALDMLGKKKNLRVIEARGEGKKRAKRPPFSLDIKKAGPFFLAQEPMELPQAELSDWGKVVTERDPGPGEWAELDFAFRAVSFVKSNAIVIVKDRAAVGVGAGQMSRVDSMDLAVKKADGRERGGVVGSDAFFPFRDSIDLAAEAGITAVVEPGGSIRDEEVIEAANEHDMAMVFAGRRVFRH